VLFARAVAALLTLPLSISAVPAQAHANWTVRSEATSDPFEGSTPGVRFDPTGTDPVVISKSASVSLYRIWRSDMDFDTPAQFELSVMRRSMLSAKAGRGRSVFLPAPAGTTNVSSTRIRLWSGQVVCLKVRQVIGGARSGWSSSSCVVRPANDRLLVAERGSLRRVDNRRFPDGRVTLMSDHARASFKGLPPVTFYGLVFHRPEISECSASVRLGAGKRRPKDRSVSAMQGSIWAIGRYRNGDRRAKFVIEEPGWGTCPIGGVFTVPRWMDVLNGYFGPYHLRADEP
jgi:hypothetical protein